MAVWTYMEVRLGCLDLREGPNWLSGLTCRSDLAVWMSLAQRLMSSSILPFPSDDLSSTSCSFLLTTAKQFINNDGRKQVLLASNYFFFLNNAV